MGPGLPWFPSFPWLRSLQQLRVVPGHQDCQLLLGVLEVRRYPAVLALLASRHFPQVRAVPRYHDLPWLHQDQGCLSDPADQPTQQDPCGQESPWAHFCQGDPPGQSCQSRLSSPDFPSYQTVLSRQETLWLLSDLHFPSCLEVPASQLLRPCLAPHFYRAALASPGSPWSRETQPFLSRLKVQTDPVVRVLLEIHLYQDLLWTLSVLALLVAPQVPGLPLVPCLPGFPSVPVVQELPGYPAHQSSHLGHFPRTFLEVP